MRFGTECQEFYRQFRDAYTTTGSILPSSRNLGRALTRPIRNADGPRRILEVGPGTGAVTAEIVRALRPGDQLDIVEINASFVAVLERRFAEEPSFRRVKEQSRIIHAPLQEVQGTAVYDFMVSGLPLNNFSLELVGDIFASYERLLKPAGMLSYFEYVWIRAMKMPFVAEPVRVRLQTLSTYLRDKIQRFQVDEEIVVLNLPPAVARHLCFAHVREGA